MSIVQIKEIVIDKYQVQKGKEAKKEKKQHKRQDYNERSNLKEADVLTAISKGHRKNSD